MSSEHSKPSFMTNNVSESSIKEEEEDKTDYAKMRVKQSMRDMYNKQNNAMMMLKKYRSSHYLSNFLLAKQETNCEDKYINKRNNSNRSKNNKSEFGHASCFLDYG